MTKAVFCETTLKAVHVKYKMIHIVHLDCTKSCTKQTWCIQGGESKEVIRSRTAVIQKRCKRELF